MSPQEMAEVEQAARPWAGRDLSGLQPGHFPLPHPGPPLAAIRQAVLNARGDALLRGRPEDHWPE
ncbi:MAG: TauD/TfdA family dioxygenase, partial [bacterium]